MNQERIQKVTESFMNIKTLKLYGWESKFQKTITKEYHDLQML